MEGGAVRHTIEKGPPKDHPSQICFNLVQRFLWILWDKYHIKIFCSEIWMKIIFWWPTFKIMCSTPIFSQLSMSNWKPWILNNLSGVSFWAAAVAPPDLKLCIPKFAKLNPNFHIAEWIISLVPVYDRHAFFSF
jgi:hypothetical protein